MKISDLQTLEGFELLQPVFQDTVLAGVYTSDLLSDVMAHAPADGVLITIQAHVNTVAVSTLAGIRAIVLCNRRPVPANLLAAAEKEGIAIFRTADHQFEASVRLAALMERTKA